MDSIPWYITIKPPPVWGNLFVGFFPSIQQSQSARHFGGQTQRPPPPPQCFTPRLQHPRYYGWSTYPALTKHPPKNKALSRAHWGKPMVNKPLIRPHFWGGLVHTHNIPVTWILWLISTYYIQFGYKDSSQEIMCMIEIDALYSNGNRMLTYMRLSSIGWWRLMKQKRQKERRDRTWRKNWMAKRCWSNAFQLRSSVFASFMLLGFLSILCFYQL